MIAAVAIRFDVLDIVFFFDDAASRNIPDMLDIHVDVIYETAYDAQTDGIMCSLTANSFTADSKAKIP